MGSVGSIQFQIVPSFSLYLFSRSIGPLQFLVSVNYRVLTCCTCHFQSGSLFVYFGLFLQVSSVSNFCPDTRRRRCQACLGSVVQLCCGEGHCKQILLVCMGTTRNVWTTRSFPQLRVVCASRVYSAQAPRCFVGAAAAKSLQSCPTLCDP